MLTAPPTNADEAIASLLASPEFAPLIMLIDFWRARAAAARDLDLSHEQILRRLIGSGSAITSPDTVQNKKGRPTSQPSHT